MKKIGCLFVLLLAMPAAWANANLLPVSSFPLGVREPWSLIYGWAQTGEPGPSGATSLELQPRVIEGQYRAELLCRLRLADNAPPPTCDCWVWSLFVRPEKAGQEVTLQMGPVSRSHLLRAGWQRLEMTAPLNVAPGEEILLTIRSRGTPETFSIEGAVLESARQATPFVAPPEFQIAPTQALFTVGSPLSIDWAFLHPPQGAMPRIEAELQDLSGHRWGNLEIAPAQGPTPAWAKPPQQLRGSYAFKHLGELPRGLFRLSLQVPSWKNDLNNGLKKRELTLVRLDPPNLALQTAQGFVGVDLAAIDPSDLKAARQLGIRWVRSPLRWDQVELKPGRRRFDTLDRRVELVQSLQMSWLPILGYPPAWASDRPALLSSQVPGQWAVRDLDAWNAWTQDLAKRYQLPFWQAWEDPWERESFLGRLVDGQPQAAEASRYNQLHKALFEQLQQIDPRARLLWSVDGQPDAAPYRFSHGLIIPARLGGSLASMGKALALRAMDAATLPVWLDRLPVPEAINSDFLEDARERSEIMAQRLLEARVCGAERVILDLPSWRLRQPDAPLAVLATLAGVLDGKTYGGQRPVTPDLMGYLFTGTGEAIWMIPRDHLGRLRLEGPLSGVKLRDVYGNEPPYPIYLGERTLWLSGPSLAALEQALERR